MLGWAEGQWYKGQSIVSFTEGGREGIRSTLDGVKPLLRCFKRYLGGTQCWTQKLVENVVVDT